MKKLVVGILFGLVLGAVAMRMFAPGGGEAAKGEAKPPEKPKENPLHLPPDKRTAVGITLGKAE